MHVETASSLFDMRRSREFSRGGGVTFRPEWVCLHTSGVVINLSKWVDHGTDSYFWYIQKPEQDLMILINLSPQILGLLQLYFPFSREKVMVEPGTVWFGWVVFCDTAFRTVCFFTGIELGIPCCTSSLTYKYCVCLSVDSALFGKHCCTRRTNYTLLILYPGSVLSHSSPILKHIGPNYTNSSMS